MFPAGSERVNELAVCCGQCIGQASSLKAEAVMFLPTPHPDKIVLFPSSNNVSLQPNNDILSVVGNCSICVQKNSVSVIRLESFVANIFRTAYRSFIIFSKHGILVTPCWLLFCPVTPAKSFFWLFSFFFPECGRCPQPSDGQHATQRWHARRTYAPGLLSSKKRNFLTSPHSHLHPSHTPGTLSTHPISIAKPVLLSPPPFLAPLAVLIPVQMFPSLSLCLHPIWPSLGC